MGTEASIPDRPDTAQQAFLRTIKTASPLKFADKKDALEADHAKRLAVVQAALYEQDRSPSAKLDNTSDSLLALVDELLAESAA